MYCVQPYTIQYREQPRVTWNQSFFYDLALRGWSYKSVFLNIFCTDVYKKLPELMFNPFNIKCYTKSWINFYNKALSTFLHFLEKVVRLNLLSFFRFSVPF